MRKKDLIGKRFGRLLVKKEERAENGQIKWFCECDCGGTKSVITTALNIGKTQSCGCIRKEQMGDLNRTHGMSRTPTHITWKGIHNRCRNKNDSSYKDYGGRGIKVCERWYRFENFLEDMGLNPDGMSIDRIDVNGGYNRENCRWATRKTQNNNKRNNRNITFNKETRTLSEWSELLGINYGTLHSRLKKLPVGKAFIA